MKHNQRIQFNTEVWKEGSLFVSYVPQLDISSCGKTIGAARKNMKEATELFLEEAERMGTLAVPVFIIKNLLRTAQINRERYFQLLEQC